MKIAAAILYALSVLCECAGVYGLVGESRAARRLRDNPPIAGIPAGNASGPARALMPGVAVVAGNQIKSRRAVALLLVGIIAGGLGNFLTL